MSPPRFPRIAELACWVLFALLIGLIVTSLAVQARGRGDGGPPEWHAFKTMIAGAFPIVLVAGLIAASASTYAAASRFSNRYEHVKRMITDGLRSRTFATNQSAVADGKLLIWFPSGGATESAENFQIMARDEYLPQPYHGLANTPISWSIPRYLELLDAERASARSSAARIAAALGTAFAAGMIAYARIVDFLQ